MASISNIIHTATSGLISSQTAMSVTTTNVANADTEGYTRKTANRSTTTVGGQATGVTIVGIGNSIDKALMNRVVEANSETSYDATIAAYYQSLVDTLGSTENGAALETAMTELMTVLSKAANAGGSADSLADVLEALKGWTNTLNSTSSSIQAARTTADQSIEEAVDKINGLLKNLEHLNDQIALADAAGDPTADLKDRQREALEQLSSLVDINYYTLSNGEVRVYSDSGAALLLSRAQTLEYTATGSLSEDVTYGSGIDGITINGKDVTSALTGGEIGALIDMRDTTLPKAQDALDALAVGVAKAINMVANHGSANPAPSTLTSSLKVNGTDPFEATGTVTVVETDKDGTVLSSVDIDLSALGVTDYNGLLTHLNTQLSANGSGVTASLVNGQIVLSTATADAGVAVTSDDATLTGDGSDLLNAWGFYDLISGSDASDMTVSDSATTNGIATATVASTTVGEAGLAGGDTSIFQGIWAALDGAIQFDAGGIMNASSRSAVSQIAALVDEIADRAESSRSAAAVSKATLSTLANSFDNAYGVNVNEEAANLVALQQSYDACAKVMSTAKDMFDTLLAMMK